MVVLLIVILYLYVSVYLSVCLSFPVESLSWSDALGNKSTGKRLTMVKLLAILAFAVYHKLQRLLACFCALRKF